MCGRFFVEYDEEFEIFQVMKKMLGAESDVFKSGDITPGMNVPVITGKSSIEPMLWGIKLKGKKPVINARSETASERFLFKNDILKHRCIIVANGFYEWSKAKEKYFYKNRDGIIYLAGIYNEKKEFAILTRSSTEPISMIHEREPVMLKSESCVSWLSDNEAYENYFAHNVDVESVAI